MTNQELVKDWLEEEGILDAYEKLCHYNCLISGWRSKYNIMGGNEEDRWRLIAESLLPIDIIKDGEIIDIGSGGGLPTIPLCLAVKYKKMVFVEPNGRKAYILSEIIRELEIKDVEIYFEQIENFNIKRRFDYITMRGLPVIKKLLKVMIRLIKDDGTIILYTDKLSDTKRLFLENNGFDIYNKEHRIFGFRGLLYLHRKEI
ncbi:MAG: RsmG family class I SAM-dependent methyltransferase [bacterium]